MTKKDKIIQYKNDFPRKGAKQISEELGEKENTVRWVFHDMKYRGTFVPKEEDVEVSINLEQGSSLRKLW